MFVVVVVVIAIIAILADSDLSLGYQSGRALCASRSRVAAAGDVTVFLSYEFRAQRA